MNKWQRFTSLIFCCLSLIAGRTLNAQPHGRMRTAFNNNWYFSANDSLHSIGSWREVNLPHTWNVDDVMDDAPGYYRGNGWYRKTFKADPGWKNRSVSLYFEGANEISEVFLNGQLITTHTGGYSGFRADLTSAINLTSNNELVVKVNNAPHADVAPLTADFSFYGGIYRDVFLDVSSPIHFATNDHGGEGLVVTTPRVSASEAKLEVDISITNESHRSEKLIVRCVLKDPGGREVSRTVQNVTIDGRSTRSMLQHFPLVKKPELWSPDRPGLYMIETSILDNAGNIVDRIDTKTGFRWFAFHANSGFWLNGKPCKLIGASRHQDYQGLGNAVPDSLAVRDIVLLKQMGANFLRVAHYPQDPCVLKACDSLGLLASVEIPIVNEITESPEFSANAENMLREMIAQNRNHPSVVIWCYMNEVLLRPHFGNDKPRQGIYFSSVAKLAALLDSTARAIDPSRYTMMANHGNLESYKKAGLLGIPMITGWNLYSGWYGGNIEELPQFIDSFHHNYPAMPFLITEYGADADPRIHSADPERFDKSVEFTTTFHSYYLQQLLSRKFVAGAIMWNLADFNSETRSESMPHMNNKGLLEWDRTPKDPYYLYKAVLSKTPFIKILGTRAHRYGIADSATGTCLLPVQLVANLQQVSISLNGAPFTTLATQNCLAGTLLAVRQGSNTITIRATTGSQFFFDSLTTYVMLQPQCLADEKLPFQQMNVVLGCKRTFESAAGEWWQPDQRYVPGRWGSIGGRQFRIANNTRLPYGTDRNILGTDDDPVYQTQLVGIEHYKLDVPAGKYQLTLHFAELLGGKVKLPPYNLDVDERLEDGARRIFNVALNGQKWLEHFNIAENVGTSRALSKTTTVVVRENEGIDIEFQPVEGEPVLNALQVKKIDTDAAKL